MGKNAYMRPNVKYVKLCMISIFMVSCSFSVNEPVDVLWDKLGEKTDRLIIFLPGLLDSASTFEEKEFFSLARKAGIKADMVAMGIHFGHLMENKMVERIELDVYLDAIKKGYKNIWLVGVSIGGLNSLLFYRKHAKGLCGVVALAPYVAGGVLFEELQKDGVDNWEPKEVYDMMLFEKKLQFLWAWLQQQKSDNNLKSVYLGYGKQDRFIEAIKLLESILDKNNIIAIEGKHDWVTGKKVWQQQLASMHKSGLLQPCNK